MGKEEEEKMGAGHAPEEKGSQRLSMQREMSRKHSMGGNNKKKLKKKKVKAKEIHVCQLRYTKFKQQQ